MMRKNFNKTALRVAALIGLTTVVVGCRGDIRTAPPVHLVRNMDNVTRCDPQEPTTFLAGGHCVQTPPAGTISTTEILPDNHLMVEGRVDGEYVTELPMPLTRELLDRGQARYEIYCAPCHGDSGFGNGTVANRAPDWDIASLHGVRHNEDLRGYPVGRIYDVVTRGYATMPAYAAQVPANDRWAISAYVRALQISQGAPRNLVPDEIASSEGW